MSNKKQKEILNTYLTKISPLMIEYEDITNEFPVGIFNEVRAIFFHFAKYETLSSTSDKNREMNKAYNHMIRALRDCYKYICVAYDSVYENFITNALQLFSENDSAKNVIKQIEITRLNAIDDLTSARVSELDVNSNLHNNEIFEAYQVAQEKYRKLYALIKEIFNC